MENTRITRVTGVTGASGRIYSNQTKSIMKLYEFPKYTEYQVIKQEHTPTKFGSYIVTIKIEGKELQVYMPKYIAERTECGKWYMYFGLQDKKNGSGHQYHSVLSVTED